MAAGKSPSTTLAPGSPAVHAAGAALPRGGLAVGKVLQLAEDLQSELAVRGLKPGDRFLSVDEVVKTRTMRRDVVNKALQILAQRGVITRRPRVGAIVCDPPAGLTAFGRIHFLSQLDDPESEPHDFTAVVLGLQQRFPGCAVQHVAMSGVDLMPRLDAVIRAAMRAREPEALILVRCSYAMQSYVAESGLPSVVNGSTWPGLPLPSVNIDNHQAGQLHAAALWEKGCRRILLLRRERLVPGEAYFARGVRAAFAQFGAAADAVDQMELPSESNVVHHALAAGVPEGPLGIIAATTVMAVEARAALPPEVPVHVGVVQGGGDSQSCRFTHATEALAPNIEGQMLADALARRLEAPGAAPTHQLLPMRLVLRA